MVLRQAAAQAATTWQWHRLVHTAAVEVTSTAALGIALTRRGNVDCKLLWHSTSGLFPGMCWCQQHLPNFICRGYATKAAANSVPAPEAVYKRRHSSTKLFGCRNSRLRHQFEQIWPTLQLTEDQVALFRRNSRQYVVDLAKSITLKNKFELGLQAAGGQKIPYQDAKSMLYESNLHLDAVGEHPRFLKIRRLRGHYAHKLQSTKKVRLMLGFAKRHEVLKMWESTLLASGPNRMWRLVSALESKLDLFFTRIGLVEDVVAAKKARTYGNVFVNGALMMNARAGFVESGDIVHVAPDRKRSVKQAVGQQLADWGLHTDIYRAFQDGPSADSLVSLERMGRQSASLPAARGR